MRAVHVLVLAVLFGWTGADETCAAPVLAPSGFDKEIFLSFNGGPNAGTGDAKHSGDGDRDPTLPHF
jgi:hypothetical protein